MGKYAKALVALAIAGLAVVSSSLTDGDMSTTESVQVVIAVATAAGVWLAANVPSLTWAKAAIAALLASLNLVVTYLASGPLTGSEWTNVILAALGVVAVYFTPNSGAAVRAASSRRAV